MSILPERPVPAKPVPKYRHYKPKNLGVVRIDGRDHYLGRFGSPESREKYCKLIAEWYATGKVGTATQGAGQASPGSPAREDRVRIR